VARSADINHVPDYSRSTPLDAAGAQDTGRQALLGWLRERGARSGAV
jgi:hypothetical protein